ncbi:MAG: DPP IV N-terminal domain-containing protein [Flavobacteriaceae bacterium]
MKILYQKLISCVVFSVFTLNSAQEITLNKIHSGYYRTEFIYGINSMNDGEHYTILEKDGIVKYSYKTGKKIETILEAKIQDYTFSHDESKVLVLNEQQPIYRHSFLGKYHVVNLSKNGKITALNNGNWVQEPKFSPDGRFVAFIFGNNLYYQDLNSEKITQITFDGEKNKIINGLADWVYEEEFGHTDMYQWTKNSESLVFVKFDESQVKEMNMQVFNGNLYPQDFRFKYPKAGEENSKVSVYAYDLKLNKSTQIDLANFEAYYIPQVFQTAQPNEIAIATSNRHQNKLEIIKINTKNYSIKKILTETDTAWIETDNLSLEFLEDNSFLWASERDGFRHFYWYTPDGKLKKQITKGNWEITDYYGFSPKNSEILVQTTEKGSTNRVVSKINIKTGKKQIVSELNGTNNADFSKSFQYFINTHSSAEQPNTYTLRDFNGKTLRELQNNNSALKKLQSDGFVNKEFFQIPNKNGDQMNAWMIKPKDFSPNKKYPVLMYQYSGPGSQQVSNAWDGRNTIWFNLLAQKGYIVLCVDGRGTGYRGTKYKKATYKNLGKYEIEDQITAAQWIGSQSFVDAGRIGIFGWSFGGYMASLAMTKGADVFKVGIAVAPVTTWRYYDTIYTERYLQTPQENPQGYDENSPINFADLMKGKYLLIHGTADDNVHYQNAVEMAEALIQKNKEFEFMTYPDKNHGIYGGNTRLHLYQKMTDFILNNL